MGKTVDLPGGRKGVVVAGQRDTLEGEAGEVLGPFGTAEVGTDRLPAEDGAVQPAGSQGIRVELGDQLQGSCGCPGKR